MIPLQIKAIRITRSNLFPLNTGAKHQHHELRRILPCLLVAVRISDEIRQARPLKRWIDLEDGDKTNHPHHKRRDASQCRPIPDFNRWLFHNTLWLFLKVGQGIHRPERNPFGRCPFYFHLMQHSTVERVLQRPTIIGLLLRTHQLDRILHPLVTTAQFSQHFKQLQHIRLVHERKSEFQPSRPRNTFKIMAPMINVMNQQKFNQFLNFMLDRIGTLLHRNRRQRFQRFGNTHETGMFSPATFKSPVWSLSRCERHSVVTALIPTNPIDSLLNTLIRQKTKFNEAEHHVPGQTGNDFTLSASFFDTAVMDGKTELFRIL